MKTATKGDKPDWFDRPANVVGVNVCRVSGKLPNYGCTNVQTIDEYGNVEIKSMVYTDYFVKGTQPTTICPVHQTMFAEASPSVPVQAAPAGERGVLPAPPPQSTSGAAPAAPAAISGGTVPKPEEAQKKKKGFWRRIFGGGDDKKDKKGGGG